MKGDFGVSFQEKYFRNKMLYKELQETIPDFIDIVPYVSLKFKKEQRESIVVHTPLISSSLFLGIDKKIGYMKTLNYLEMKYGKPETKIQHITRSLLSKVINVFKPFASYFLGYPGEGDFSVLINDYEKHLCYFLKINHKKEEAELLGRSIYTPKEIFEKVNSTDLLNYLKDPKVKLRLSSNKILTEHSKLER